MPRFHTKVVVPDLPALQLENVRFAVGLDLSHNSPGCAIFDAVLQKWYICGFAQLAREDVKFHYATEKAEVWLFDVLPTTHNDVLKYIHVEEHLMKFLCAHIPFELRAKYTDVRVEAYAFCCREESGYNFKLHESGGIIKRALHHAGFLHVTPIVTSQWKRTVINKGNCSKIDVIHFVAKYGPMIDMLLILGYEESTLSKDEKGRLIVPSPCQDMADAVAIALEVFTKRVSIAKRKQDLLETVNQSQSQRVKGACLAIRKKTQSSKKKLKLPPPPPQPAFLPPTPQSLTSFWVSKPITTTT